MICNSFFSYSRQRFSASELHGCQYTQEFQTARALPMDGMEASKALPRCYVCPKTERSEELSWSGLSNDIRCSLPISIYNFIYLSTLYISV